MLQFKPVAHMLQANKPSQCSDWHQMVDCPDGLHGLSASFSAPAMPINLFPTQQALTQICARSNDLGVCLFMYDCASGAVNQECVSMNWKQSF